MLHEKIRFVTANYYQLQGLRLLPLGAFFVFAAAARQGWLDWLPGGPRPWGGLGVFLAIGGAIAATAYYKRRFGVVAQHGRRKRNWMIALAMMAFFLVAPIDKALHSPIILSALVVSVALAVTVYADGWIRAHYAVGAVLWLGVSLRRLMPLTAESADLVLYGAAGLTLIVCGVGDHLVMMRTLGETGRSIDVSNPTTI